MSAHANPDIVDDSLVFIYDTDDGKSFKGEPTVNLATDSPSQGGWAGGREVLDSSRKKFRFIVDNFNASAGSGQGWRSFTWDLNSYSGQSVTISATVEVPSASPGTFAWIMMGQTNTHTSNNSGAGQYMGYSASSERVQKTTTTTEHITWTGTVGSTGTASQPSGHVGFTLWYNGGTIGVDSYVEVSNVQIEINSHATQFVNGTRSATQGLLDRTGTSTIDISNASFDSNAQMTFDGTDDYFEISDPNVSSSDGFSVELIIKPDNPTSSPAVIVPNSGGIDHWIRFDGNGRLYIRMIPAANSGGQNFITSTELSSGNYHHVVFTFKQSEGGKAYYNGALETSAAATLTALDWSGIWRIGQRGNNTWFLEGELPMLKIYNKTLTTSEVLQNFNATKSRFGL
jgi:hypothetical protein